LFSFVSISVVVNILTITLIIVYQPHHLRSPPTHPHHHVGAACPVQDMVYLKEKIDAGADLILTQFFYDEEVYFDYVRRCRAAGITVPILPGMMPIQVRTRKGGESWLACPGPAHTRNPG
jgi:hypothetical protein